jgi:hypothetical protein
VPYTGGQPGQRQVPFRRLQQLRALRWRRGERHAPVLLRGERIMALSPARMGTTSTAYASGDARSGKAIPLPLSSR